MKDATRILVLLDRTGSMQVIQRETVTSMNSFISELRKAPGECSVKLVQWDSPSGGISYDVIYDKPLSDVPVLKDSDYQPRGMTPLWDAMGIGITELGQELNAIPEKDRPEKIIVCVITDGEENQSTRYTQQQVADMVKHQTEKYNWKFTFLGANQDAVLTAAKVNIPRGQTLTYTSNNIGAVAHSAALFSNKVRGGFVGQSVGYSDQDREDAVKQD